MILTIPAYHTYHYAYTYHPYSAALQDDAEGQLHSMEVSILSAQKAGLREDLIKRAKGRARELKREL